MPLGEQRGGGELMLLELLRNAQVSGMSWSLIVFEDGPLVTEATSLGIATTVVRAGRLRQVRRYLQTVGAIRRSAQDADLVFSWMTKAHLYGGPAAVLAHKPAVWFQLGVPSPRNWMDRLATSIPSKGVLTLSRAGDRAQAALRPSRPTRMIYPSVDLSRFSPRDPVASTQAKETLSLPTSARIVGLVARLQRWKGIHVAIDAFPGVMRTFPDALLVVVGGSHFSEPGYQSELLKRASGLGIADNVVLVGLQRDIPSWLSAMDVVVHASFDEPFGISIIEAMAMGRPVVASDSGGPLEIIEDGTNGLLFRTGDQDSLAHAVERVLSDPQEAARLGRNARLRAEEFSSDRFAAEIGRALGSLVAGVERRNPRK
jgi:glycosyltransferase involved in cell wall biosynthesis